MKADIHLPRVVRRVFRSGCWRCIEIYEQHEKSKLRCHLLGFRHASGGVIDLWFASPRLLDRFVAALARWKE